VQPPQVKAGRFAADAFGLIPEMTVTLSDASIAMNVSLSACSSFPCAQSI
jgi:hypothetical protein